MTRQRIATKNEPIEKALKYYSLLSIMYSWSLTKKQIELLAFTAIRGTITPPKAREDFISRFDSSKDSLNNLKCQLTKKKLLLKEGGMHRVNPRIVADFNKDIMLEVHLNGQDKATAIPEGGSTTEQE